MRLTILLISILFLVDRVQSQSDKSISKEAEVEVEDIENADLKAFNELTNKPKDSHGEELQYDDGQHFEYLKLKISHDEFDLEAFLEEMLLEGYGDEEWEFPDLFGNLDELNEEQEESVTQADIDEPLDDFFELPDIISEWPELLQNFSPDDMIAFELQSGGTEVLLQIIELPTTVRGAFFLPLYPESNKIDFQIQNQANDFVYTIVDVQDHIFSVDIKAPGEYKFIFSNKRSDDTYLVNFALDAHSSRIGHLKQQDIDPFSQRLENLHNAMRDNYFENKFTQSRQESGYVYLAQTHNKLLFFTVLETLGVVAINLWQIFYIKRILENKRLI